MSPEQPQGLPADPRSDVFSLGVVFYEMATGRRPFQARSAAEIVSAILRDVPVPPTRLRPGLPGRVDRLIARCLEKEPRYRLQSAVDLVWELEQVKAEAGREGGQARTIAVLPFVDQSREKDQDYLCDGLAEDVLIALGKVKGLRVASRAASFRFRSPDADVKETGRRLGVEAIVHGSVRKAGSRLRLAVELVDVADGFEIWAEVYERGVEEVFTVQAEVARAIVRALEVDLSEGEQASLRAPAAADVQAWDHYQQARRLFYQYSKRGMRFARDLFERAIAVDPRYARAWCGLSDCAAFLYANAGRHPEDLEQAEATSRRALELDPGLAEAHASRGVTLSLRGRHEEAEAAFEHAIRLNPQLFEAHYFYARDAFAHGDLEKAILQYEEAIRIRPEDYQSPLLVAQSFEDLGRSGRGAGRAPPRRPHRRGAPAAPARRRARPLHGRQRSCGARGDPEGPRVGRPRARPRPARPDAAVQHRLHPLDGRGHGRRPRVRRAGGRGGPAPQGLVRARLQPGRDPRPPALPGPDGEPGLTSGGREGRLCTPRRRRASVAAATTTTAPSTNSPSGRRPQRSQSRSPANTGPA